MNLMPVITWLENGCDPKEAAKELRIYQAKMDGENERMRHLLNELLTQLGERDRGDGNAPGHAHDIPGIWDSDNGKLAGKPCAWCALWAEAKATILTQNV